jgi:hypothetical protein
MSGNVTVPYSDVGKASFEQLDTWLASFLLAGDTPELASYPFAAEQNQVLAMNTVVGLNARKKLVPATVTETQLYFVSNVAIVNAGSGGTNGAAVMTGTTGTGTKFQANVTIAGGVITAVNSMAVEGNYTVSLTDPTAEPVTGGNVTGATLAVTMESLVTTVAGVQAIGVLTQALTTAVGEDLTTVPVFYSGCFNIRALVWDSSFAHDSDKFNAFMGAPTPTTITIKKRQSDV